MGVWRDRLSLEALAHEYNGTLQEPDERGRVIIGEVIIKLLVRLAWITLTTASVTLYVYWIFHDYPGQAYPILVGAVALIAWRADAITAAITLMMTAALIDWYVLKGEGLAIEEPAQAAGMAILLAVGAVMIWTMTTIRRNRQEDAAMTDIAEEHVARLQKQLENRKNQLEELVHRVRNDLTTLGSIAALYGRDPNPANGLRAMGDRINVLGKIYQRLHISDRTDAEIEMKSFLEALVNDLRDTHVALRPISISIDADTVVLPMRIAAVIGLTVNEAVTNALKYAFPDDREGQIQVCLKRRKSDLRLTIVDDGVGPSGEQPKGTGMGSRLMRAMAAQINGAYALQRDPDATVVSVEIPLEG